MRRGLVLGLMTCALAAPMAGSSYSAPSDEALAASASVGVSQAVNRYSASVAAMPEEAAMVLVGSMLIGIAAAVRRTAA